MTVLTIRDVPDEVRDALANEAKARGQSMQAYLLGVLKRQADFSYNRSIIIEIEADLLAHGGATAAADPARALRAERDENDAWLDADE